MIIESINVANLKCSGCAQTVTNKLSKLAGVHSITVSVEEEHIEIAHDGILNRNHFIEALVALGYPESTAENGLLTKAKSYASCMVGKLSTIS